HFLSETAAYVLGEGAIVLVPRGGEPRSVSVHDGAVLTSAADAARIVTGGADGKVVATDAEGESTILAGRAKHGRIEHVPRRPAAAARSRGRRAGRPACALRRARGAGVRCRRRSGGWRSRRRGCTSPSPITTASRSRLRTRRASRSDCNGRAPISTWR